MPEYTFLRIDHDDRVIQRITRTCQDESAAIKVASELADGGVVELWEGPQKIVVIGNHSAKRP